MKLAVVVAALTASVALSAPAEAASKKSKRVAHHAYVTAPMERNRATLKSQDVYFAGEVVGRDPDLNIRAYMHKDPHPWDSAN